MSFKHTKMDSTSSESNRDFAIRVNDLSKCYQIYDNPANRLKQFVIPRFKRILNIPTQNYFTEFWALKNISLEVKKGETVGIIGRNGSGKSTLLQIICGTLHPSAGHIEVNGRVAALLELGSGFNPEFTGRENVFLNASILGLSLQKTQDRYSQIEAFADIGDFINQPVKTYSSGMMVRLAFAVIAHVDADILVIDEALAVGDAFFTQKCMRFLREFMKNGTVLFVSHDTGSVKTLCNKAIWLDKGKIIQEGTSKSVCELYLQAFYEAQKDKDSMSQISSSPKKNLVNNITFKDQRLEYINQTNLRNDLKLFPFEPDSSGFGQGGATISDVKFVDTEGNVLNWIVGGETVSLIISADCHQHLHAPIIGFAIKDKLGQVLFGDNTYISYLDHQNTCDVDQVIQAEFTFEMPRLANGDYTITVAIANGSQHVHEQHHWIFDAIHFKSESTSVSSGLIGIPMRKIELTIS